MTVPNIVSLNPSQVLDRLITITVFPDRFARSKRQVVIRVRRLPGSMAKRTASSKHRLPLLKLATFGDEVTRNGCLRTNRNTQSIDGVEGDYDGEKVSVDEAMVKVQAAKIAAIVYTSPSHTPSTPRWRVLAFTSSTLPPEARGGLVARLNGALGGILNPESFTLSQPFYFGCIDGNPHYRCEMVDGRAIDEAHEFEAVGANGKPYQKRSTATGGNPQADIEDVVSALNVIPNDDRPWDEWNNIGMAIWRATGASEEGREAFHTWSEKARGKYDVANTDARWEHFAHSPPTLIGFRALESAARKGDPTWTLPSLERAVDESFPILADETPEEVAPKEVAPKEAAPKEAAPKEAAPKEKSDATVRLRHGGTYKMQKIEWVWPGWFARGKFHILGGLKGAGKSTLVFTLAAAITTGGKFPDGSQAPLGDVLIWSGEDDIADTILPRIAAAGGDIKRVYFPDRVNDQGEKRRFDPATDMPLLLEAARGIPKLKLMIIDPIVNASKADSHKNAETRRGLQPVVDFAEERRIALIGITHFTKNTQGKNPIERITGTLAYGALPRVVMGAAKASEEAPRRFIRIESNIGKSGGGFEYLLRQEPVPGHDFTAQRVKWGNQLTGTAAELLEGIESPQSEKFEVLTFLEDMLTKAGDAGMAVKELKRAAVAHCISWRTIERAKAGESRITARQVGGAAHAGWKWFWKDDGSID